MSALEQTVADLTAEELERTAADWVDELAAALADGNYQEAAELFLDDGYWRDLLALTWDFRTFHGRERIEGMLAEHLAAAGLTGLALTVGKQTQLLEPDPDLRWIEAFVSFETSAATGRSVVRLREDADGRWRAWTFLTAIAELKGHERALGPRRRRIPEEAHSSQQNWRERRARETKYSDADPQVLVIGGAHCGLSIAAELGLLGVDTLVIERTPRIGDKWRNRYHTLVLHDPVWADHLPYMPFPDTWPVYTPKDKLADWLEYYAGAMELNVWAGAELLDSSYDENAKRWTVGVRRSDGSERVVHPAHIVLATGSVGDPYIPLFEGSEDFDGVLVHSTEYSGGKGWAGKRAVIIGTGNSGHDIAQDLFEQGADVTLVQRSATYVMSQANGIPIIFGGLYREDGPALEDADLLNAAYPYPVIIELGKLQARAIAELDAELLEGLEQAGFKLDRGEDGGLMAKALHRAGGFYIDVGCSQLIVDGKVKVKQGSVARFTKTGITLDDGSSLDADLVVLATGYTNMRDMGVRLFGEEPMKHVKTVWGLDEEGEIKTLWRASGHPGFWFTGGSLAVGRVYSKYLALQIKGRELGLVSSPQAAR
jgi:cation diffusion facilitator CzcD-associated flavoprotein CzcO